MSLRGVNSTNVWIDEWWEDSTETKRIATLTKENKLLISPKKMYYAKPVKYSYTEHLQMVDWCFATFGGNGYRQDNMTTVWDYHNGAHYMFWFSDEKNLMMFILRWS